MSLRVAYGRHTYSPTVRAVWGARLIAPSDLVHDRQDLAAYDQESRSQLIAWLNGPVDGNGAIFNMIVYLRNNRLPNDDSERVIYEDDKGKIIGSCQSSGGYVYVAGWLKAHVGDGDQS